MLAIDALIYWAPLTGLSAVAAVLSIGWHVLTKRHKKIVSELMELSQRQERCISQVLNSSPVIEPRSNPSIKEDRHTEFRRMVGDVLATGFQLCAVERARAQHPELDTRIAGQLKDRGITLVSRIWLFVDREDRAAQDLVAMLRAWILEPRPDRYSEWERRAYHLAQDVICGARSHRVSEVAGGVNFASMAAAD